MVDKAPAEVCRNFDFDRAILSRVEGLRLVIESVYVEGDPELAARVLSFAREKPPDLNEMLVESEMLRRGAPALVGDARNDPRTFKPLIEFAGVRAYVAAPIMPEGRVIGFLHAERADPGRPLDTVDRDTLWTFAEGFGYALEGAILLSKLRSQREQIRILMASTDEVMDDFTDSEIDLISVDRTVTALEQSTSAMLSESDSRIEALLTRREIEVLELMAKGATNRAAAERLVISEATVKHHVKNILRKLYAANRAEAVARYLKIVGSPRS